MLCSSVHDDLKYFLKLKSTFHMRDSFSNSQHIQSRTSNSLGWQFFLRETRYAPTKTIFTSVCCIIYNTHPETLSQRSDSCHKRQTVSWICFLFSQSIIYSVRRTYSSKFIAWHDFNCIVHLRMPVNVSIILLFLQNWGLIDL